MLNSIIICRIELFDVFFTNDGAIMKKQEIISVLYELHKITGFRMSLHSVDFVEIAAYPEDPLPICARIHGLAGEFEGCRADDKEIFQRVHDTKKTIIYQCRHGLTEAVSPLYNFGILTGYLMMGQICDDKANTDKLLEKLLSLGISDAEELVSDMRVVPSELINSYVKIMTVCAQYLTLSNAMPGERPTVAEAAKRYIHENIDKKITIKDICDAIACSKTTLISAFKREFGTTVNAAITEAKISEAKKLLIAGTMTVNEVAHATGFYDQSYFSKVFLAAEGISPSDYRKAEGEG